MIRRTRERPQDIYFASSFGSQSAKVLFSVSLQMTK